MKQLGILLLALILGTTVTFAQDRGGQRLSPEDQAKRTTETLKKELDLKSDQEKKVYEINLKSSKEMAKMREEAMGGGSREGMREKFTKIREASDKELKTVLTDAQWKKYEAYQKKREEEMRQRRGQGGPGGR